MMVISLFTKMRILLLRLKIPVVLAVVGSWLEPKAGQKVDFSGEEIPRDKILSWGELKEMQDSGFVEIASHSYHLHRGITGNPQGNSEPAATTRFYDVKLKLMKMTANIWLVFIMT